MTPWTILITGSRDLPIPELVGHTISHIILNELAGRPVIIRHGDCPGPNSADQAAATWVRTIGPHFGVTEDPMPADWDNCGPGCPSGPHRITREPDDVYHPGTLPDWCPYSGPRRNADMVAQGANEAVAFPHPRLHSRGTAHCTKLAKAAHIPTRIITTWQDIL